jgi:peptidyl-prolyl cis-trans isomerase B (cyclophilin B)
MKKIIPILIVLFMTLTQTGCSQGSTQSGQPAGGAETLVLIKTSYGDITLKLYNDTPKHRDNFLKLIREGWYDDSPFHRIIPQFMIQGGGNKDGRQDPGYTVEAEFRPNHLHKKGALAAARMGDQVNPKKASSGCQFYIVQGSVLDENTLNQYEQRSGVKFTPEQRKTYTTIGGSPWLDGAYTVFGEVVTGFDVVDKIAAVPRDSGDKPLKPVTMKIEILE